MVTTHPYIDEKFHCYNHFAVVGAIIYPFLPPPPWGGSGWTRTYIYMLHGGYLDGNLLPLSPIFSLSLRKVKTHGAACAL